MFKFQPLVAVFAVAALMPLVSSSAQQTDAAKMMKQCALVCSTCQIECDSCFAHCLQLVADGKTEHKATAQLCADCAECCKACATLCSRNSPLAKHMLECCAKCCEDCATACEKFPDDEQMMACAKSCRDCAKTCLEMSERDHQ